MRRMASLFIPRSSWLIRSAVAVVEGRDGGGAEEELGATPPGISVTITPLPPSFGPVVAVSSDEVEAGAASAVATALPPVPGSALPASGAPPSATSASGPVPAADIVVDVDEVDVGAELEDVGGGDDGASFVAVIVFGIEEEEEEEDDDEEEEGASGETAADGGGGADMASVVACEESDDDGGETDEGDVDDNGDS